MRIGLAAIPRPHPSAQSHNIAFSGLETPKQGVGAQSRVRPWTIPAETRDGKARVQLECLVTGRRMALFWGCGCEGKLKLRWRSRRRSKGKVVPMVSGSDRDETGSEVYRSPTGYLPSGEKGDSSVSPANDGKAQPSLDSILTLRRPPAPAQFPVSSRSPAAPHPLRMAPRPNPGIVDLAEEGSTDSSRADWCADFELSADSGTEAKIPPKSRSDSDTQPPRKGPYRRPKSPGRESGPGRTQAQAKASDRAERLQNGMARHRTHSLTKPQRKNPTIQHVLGGLRRRRGSNSTVAAVMKEHQDSLTPGEVYVLLNELQRQHDWRSVIELFKWIKRQAWHRPSGRFYNMMIGFMGREGQPSMATLMFQEMLLERQEPNSYTYTALINAYGRARMFDDALAVFAHMKECDSAESRPNTVTCNALIGALCRGRLYDQAVEVFLDMREGRNGLSEDCRPSIVTYNTLIDSLCRESQLEAAVDVLADLADGKLDNQVVPNTVTYNTIIDACGKAGNASKAEELVRDMEARGLSPDGITFTALIDAYGKGGLLDKAESTFRGMQTRGVRADVLAYTALLSAYGRTGLLDRAEALFEEMKGVRIEPNEVTFLSMIDAYGKAGNFKRAEEVFRSMVAGGHRPNVYTYSALMDAYGKCGEYRALVRTFEAMKREGCRANLITYAALLNACGRCESWENALLLLYCLQQSGSEWELAMCRLVMGGPEEKDVWENAMRMFEGMQQLSQGMRRSFYNALIDTLWSFGLRGRAARVMAVGRNFGVYGAEMFLYDCRDHLREWQLDLHDSSVGAAAACFYAWLREIRLGWQWAREVPERIYIVTGWGKHTKRQPGDSPLKAAILAELQRLGAPFEEDPQNPGRIHASGESVRMWITRDGMEDKLELVDTTNPRPAGEMPYED